MYTTIEALDSLPPPPPPSYTGDDDIGKVMYISECLWMYRKYVI